jgi:hypothetical protein
MQNVLKWEKHRVRNKPVMGENEQILAHILYLNFPPIFLIVVMQAIAYILACIYCVAIINNTSGAIRSNPFYVIDVCHRNCLLDPKLSYLKTDRFRSS